ncbi:hypothetical protein PSACC_02901 [Paramicrosporidium saccamoebae]|uniref:Uncharacterized protein n=1 Tax=Paramicrosporidium saccamoebae TaxID=1246581 RepID=A0A2H9THP0_9FUNG|nr:hypothetical protein PSACC_02901 [Paramicrosporidium saccamoebae]
MWPSGEAKMPRPRCQQDIKENPCEPTLAQMKILFSLFCLVAFARTGVNAIVTRSNPQRPVPRTATLAPKVAANIEAMELEVPSESMSIFYEDDISMIDDDYSMDLTN